MIYCIAETLRLLQNVRVQWGLPIHKLSQRELSLKVKYGLSSMVETSMDLNSVKINLS